MADGYSSSSLELGTHLKLNFASALQDLANGRAQDQVFLQGRKYPCTVAKVVSPGIVTVNFEVDSKPFTLPQVTIPIVGSEYIRNPVKVGDKGMVIAADVRLGGITGLGTGVPDLTQPGNLSGLAFLWLGNTNWATQNDLGLPIDPTAVSFYSALSCVTSMGSAGVIVSGSKANLTVNGLSSLLGGSTTITMPIGDSSLNIATTAFVTGSIGHPGSGYLPLSGGTVTGLTTFQSQILVNNSYNSGQIMMAPNTNNSGIGAMFRNDGGNLYLLFTNNNDAFGTWNSLRPWFANCTSGAVTMQNGLNITGGLTSDWHTANGNVTVNGNFQVNGPATGWQVPMVAYTPSMAGGNGAYMAVGVNWANYNMACVLFYYNGYGSTSNTAQLSVLNGPSFYVDGNGNCTCQGALNVTGTINSGNWINTANTLYLGGAGAGHGAISTDGGTNMNIGTGSSGNLNQIVFYCNNANFQGQGIFYQPLTANNTITVNGQCNLNGTVRSYATNTRSGYNGGWGGNTYNFYWTGAALQGWVDNSNQGNVSFVSDYRIKRNVQDLDSTWDKVKKLHPIRYNMRDFSPPDSSRDPNEPLFKADDVEHWGFIAHELQETLIEDAATGVKDDPVYIQAPNPWVMIAALTKTLQEAMQRIEALEARA